MPEIKLTIKGYMCLRCDHEWIPKKEGYPKVCAKCHSPYWDTPKKKSGVKKRKGLSPLVSFVIITALSIAGIALTLTVVMPTINRMRTSGIINEAFNQLKLIDSLIKEVASEGIGSQRVFNLHVSSGEYSVNNETGQFEFEYSTKYSPFEAGLSAYRDGIYFTTGTAGVNAYERDVDGDGLPELIIENEAMTFVVRKYPFEYQTWGIKDVG